MYACIQACSVTQLCPTFCNPIDCSLPGSSVHGASVHCPSKKIGVGCHFLLQGIFLTQGSNSQLLHLLHWQVDSVPLCSTWEAYISTLKSLFSFPNPLSQEISLLPRQTAATVCSTEFCQEMHLL